jgi:2-polyprenyl-3-methyl-5-hydroxy-6-metoxy-1,4-benzoquinol methylase
MMINNLLARFYRPENSWDPISPEYASKYGANEWLKVNETLLDELENWIGGFQGKRILDLGGGPGQYSIAFAKRGATVTWHDVSRTYLNIARDKAIEFGVLDNIKFSLGYLDEAPLLLQEPFDLVFNRICWNYGFSDSSFADVVYRMVSPGGSGYVDVNNSEFQREQLSASPKFRTWLNSSFGIKIGHPYPPHGRLAHLFLSYPIRRLTIDYSNTNNDKILFQKPI